MGVAGEGSVTAPRRRLLLVYPAFPRTYWGMQYSLPLVGKKALMPPLGLITIWSAALCRSIHSACRSTPPSMNP